MLNEKLAQITEEAQRLRASATDKASAPPQEVLAEVASSGKLLERFLNDITEAIKQVFVAGLAYPDPELPDELESLCERARQLHLATALEHLGKLKLFIEAIAQERHLEGRHRFAQNAWEETQRLLAWVRMFRAEYDFLSVQGKMAAQALGNPGQRARAFLTRSASVWPLGIELESDGKLLFRCRDIDTGQDVFLHDHLAEFSFEDPFGARVISRLFQNAIFLSEVLGSVIRLEEHPVLLRGGALHFRPAFQSLPKILPVASNFTPPALPAFQKDDPALSRQGIVSCLTARISLIKGMLTLRDQEYEPLSVHINSTLRFNLTKLLSSQETTRTKIDLVVLSQEEELFVLSMTTDLGERVFPTYDPRLFGLPSGLLARRAQEEHARLSAPFGDFLKTAVYLLSGAPPEAIDALLTSLRQTSPKGLEALYRWGLACFLLREPLPAQKVEEIAGAVLALARRKEREKVDLDLLALVLGNQDHTPSPADLRYLDGAAIYRALWLIHASDLVESFADELKELYQARYAGELKDPSLADVAARSLLLEMLESIASPDEEKETLEEEEEALEEEGEETSKALLFLEAYLQDLRYKRGRSKKLSLPEPIELLQLADTYALLTYTDRHGATVLALELSTERIRQTCADALHHWLSRQERDPQTVLAAADAMLLVAAANLRAYFVV